MTFPKHNLDISCPVCGSLLALSWNPNLVATIHHLTSAYLSSPSLVPNPPPIQKQWAASGDKKRSLLSKGTSLASPRRKGSSLVPKSKLPISQRNSGKMTDGWCLQRLVRISCGLNNPCSGRPPSYPSHSPASPHAAIHLAWIQQFPHNPNASSAAETWDQEEMEAPDMHSEGNKSVLTLLCLSLSCRIGTVDLNVLDYKSPESLCFPEVSD